MGFVKFRKEMLQMKTVRSNRKLLVRGALSALLIICMMLTILSAFAEEAFTQEGTVDPAKGATVDVVVLTQDVSAGKKITKKQLEVKQVKNVNIPDNIISSVDEVAGLFAKVDVFAGDYIYKEQLTSDEGKTGEVNNDLLYQPIKKSADPFVYVTDYFPANAGKDVAALLQELIDQNPQRTIYFPDGEYLISKPIITPSDGDRAVSLYLSDGAVIKADKDNWKTVKSVDQKGMGYTVSSLVGLGAAGTATNNNRKNGSYFFVMGGTFDGNGVADGISLEQGRETLVRNVVIKNFKEVGLSIPRGTNSTSSDDDVEDVTIVGNGGLRTVGVSVIGYDNTFTNIKIYNCERGFDLASGGNALRNIQVYYDPSSTVAATLNKKHAQTMGINETCGGNFVYQCYVENCATGIRIEGNTAVDSCKVVWNQPSPSSKQVAYAKGGSKMYMSACAAIFYNNTGSCYIAAGTNITIEAPIVNDSLCADKTYKNYVKFNKAVVPAK